MTVRVREAVFPQDAASVSSLLEEYLLQTEAEKALRGLSSPSDSLPDRYAEQVADPAALLAGMRVIVASVEAVDCGIIIVSEREPAGSELKRFWVRPEARAQGVGTELISEALRHASRPVRLSVWEWREPAIRMYERLDFSPASSREERPGLVFLRLE